MTYAPRPKPSTCDPRHRARTRSISRSASTRPASPTWARCFLCVPRSSPRSALPISSHALSRTLLAPCGRAPPRFSARSARPAARNVCPVCDPRHTQHAKKFNQQLSFDTSSVTNTGGMFVVCPPPRPAPPQSVQPHPLPLCTPRAPRGRPVYPRDGGGSCTRSLRPSRSHAIVLDSAGGSGWSAHLRKRDTAQKQSYCYYPRV